MGRVLCCEKNSLKKGPWTPEEDQKLIDYIHKHGHGNWRKLPKNAGLKRCGKSCRLRWTNYLRPDIKRGRFTSEEEDSIIHLQSILGNKWSAIASHLPGRTDNEIKNYWNTHIRKKLLSMGIDPVTHSPTLDLSYIYSILTSSLYANSSQFNIQRYPIENTHLLKLASSPLFSQQCEEYQNDDLCNSHILNQIQNPVQQVSYTELVEPNVNLYINNGTSLSTLVVEDYVPPLLPRNNYTNYSSDNQNLIDPSLSETTTLHSINNGNQNFSFASVISTPSSNSPTQLNSSSTFFNWSIKEDGRENHGSCNMLKFENPEILDVGEFM